MERGQPNALKYSLTYVELRGKALQCYEKPSSGIE